MQTPEKKRPVHPRLAPRFEVFQDAAGEHRWRLRAANGEIVAVSEGYTRRHDAVRAVSRVRMLAAKASLTVTR